MITPIRAYVDTSVFGGAFDEEFRHDSRAFLQHVREGRVRIILSPVVTQEIAVAPIHVQELAGEFAENADHAPITIGAVDLQNAYLAAQVVGRSNMTDALHVALATVHRADTIVSWNFRHIVNFRRIQMYNGINLIQGYNTIAIYSPREVNFDED